VKIVENYSFPLKKTPSHAYSLEVWLYDSREEMVNDFKGIGKHKDAEAMFIPARGNTKYVGSIRLAKDCLTTENVIHEAMHAAIELNRHMRKIKLDRHEENIVSSAAQLAAVLLTDFNLLKGV
jgi:hypothetical protein